MWPRRVCQCKLNLTAWRVRSRANMSPCTAPLSPAVAPLCRGFACNCCAQHAAFFARQSQAFRRDGKYSREAKTSQPWIFSVAFESPQLLHENCSALHAMNCTWNHAIMWTRQHSTESIDSDTCWLLTWKFGLPNRNAIQLVVTCTGSQPVTITYKLIYFQ